MSLKLRYVRQVVLSGPQIVTPPRRHLNTINHSSARVADYARRAYHMSTKHTSSDRYFDDTCALRT